MNIVESHTNNDILGIKIIKIENSVKQKGIGERSSVGIGNTAYREAEVGSFAKNFTTKCCIMVL